MFWFIVPWQGLIPTSRALTFARSKQMLSVILQHMRDPQPDLGAQKLLVLSQPTELFLIPSENSSKPRKSVWRLLSTKGLMAVAPQTNLVRSWSQRGAFLRAWLAARAKVGMKGSGQGQDSNGDSSKSREASLAAGIRMENKSMRLIKPTSVSLH